MKHRILAAVLSSLLLISVTAGCSNSSVSKAESSEAASAEESYPDEIADLLSSDPVSSGEAGDYIVYYEFVDKSVAVIDDYAQVFTDDQEKQLLEKAEEASGKAGCSVVLVAEWLEEGSDLDSYAKEYYSDTIKHFRNEHELTDDGYILIANFSNGQYRIIPFGTAEDYFSAEKLDEYNKTFVNYMNEQKFYDAFCYVAENMV